MADKTKIVPGNVEGDFFVDTTCIHCSNCRDLAPGIFQSHTTFYAVARQPQTPEELQQSLRALVCCPKGAIGTHEKHDLKPIIDSFPEHIADGVYYFGFNSPASFGGKSYFIKSDSGNWMIDSPKFSPRLVKWIEENGGLQYIFLTHRDDIAECAAYAARFAAKRIIHKEDAEAQPDAEIIIEGSEGRSFDGGITVIPQAGHTEGHCMLHYKRFLFSGDVLTSRHRFDELVEAWEPFYCWWSWQHLTESLEQLRNYSFEVVLPAHGQRASGSAQQMQNALDAAIKRCREEKDPDPCTEQRAAFFLGMVDAFSRQNQPVYAAIMKSRAEAIRQRLAACI